MKKNNAILGIVVLIVGISCFIGGMKYQESKVKKQTSVFGMRQNRNGSNSQVPNGSSGQAAGGASAGQRPSGGGQIMGTISSIDDSTITIKTMDGSSRIIVLSTSTVINKAAEATKSDLSVGTTIAVFGTEGTDKTVTAKNIQINPTAPAGAPGAEQPASAQ